MENLPVNKKEPLFACTLIKILQDKKQTHDQNQNSPEDYSEIDVILA